MASLVAPFLVHVWWSSLQYATIRLSVNQLQIFATRQTRTWHFNNHLKSWAPPQMNDRHRRRHCNLDHKLDYRSLAMNDQRTKVKILATFTWVWESFYISESAVKRDIYRCPLKSQATDRPTNRSTHPPSEEVNNIVGDLYIWINIIYTHFKVLLRSSLFYAHARAADRD